MPMYWEAVLAKAAVLTPHERGHFYTMVGHWWTTGSLPSDSGKLGLLCGAVSEEERVSAKAVFDEYFATEEAITWLSDLRKTQEIRHVKMSEGGRKGGLRGAKARLKPGSSILELELEKELEEKSTPPTVPPKGGRSRGKSAWPTDLAPNPTTLAHAAKLWSLFPEHYRERFGTVEGWVAHVVGDCGNYWAGTGQLRADWQAVVRNRMDRLANDAALRRPAGKSRAEEIEAHNRRMLEEANRP